MPTYQYRCKKCNRIEEIICNMGAAPKYIKCSICNSNSYRKYYLVSIRFKGKGFYCNDK